jgi:uncharacterized membrane protein
MEPRRRLDVPKTPRGLRKPKMKSDAFGAASESVARFFGTARYLTIQTLLVIVWICFNVVALGVWKFDPYPFILLNLAFSTQAAYAAPLILLAQNRQAIRDRVQSEADRARDERTIADAEYLAREIAAIRIALGDMVTRDYLRSELAKLDSDRDRYDERDSFSS